MVEIKQKSEGTKPKVQYFVILKIVNALSIKGLE